MSEEKPLHVLVAEALGWTACHPGLVGRRWWGIVPEGWSGYDPEEFACPGDKGRIPLFDEWWSATGPLIQKYALCLDYGNDSWRASRSNDDYEHGPTALLAVCRLLVSLREKGVF